MRRGQFLRVNTHVHRWTKLLRKKGKQFDDVVQRLRSTSAFRLSQRYASLRDKVVAWYLAPKTNMNLQQQGSLGGDALVEVVSYHEDQTNCNFEQGAIFSVDDIDEFIDTSQCI